MENFVDENSHACGKKGKCMQNVSNENFFSSLVHIMTQKRASVTIIS
jgi:hypothetical protein